MISPIIVMLKVPKCYSKEGREKERRTKEGALERGAPSPPIFTSTGVTTVAMSSTYFEFNVQSKGFVQYMYIMK